MAWREGLGPGEVAAAGAAASAPGLAEAEGFALLAPFPLGGAGEAAMPLAG